ncbi:MAG: hypothetical protein IJX89_00095 [Alphaproteobacteria bacterium]|nr:hypothetical protein [Alphaproteobacteria bacterium]
MTNMTNIFNAGIEALQQGAKVHGFKKGAEAINLAAIFQKRGITFGTPNNNNEI